MRFLRWPLAAILVFLQLGSWAELTANASSPSPGKTDEGFSFSIMQTTQGNFGNLSIGAGYMGGGPYLDENGVRQEGLYASLTITIKGEPSQFQQPDVHEGQTLEVAGYRIFVEKIIPDGRRGTIILHIWGP